MPLTPRKLKHIASLYPKILQQRTQAITLVCKNADGTTTPIQRTAIWRPMADDDPALTGHAGTDVTAMFLGTDITLPQLRSVVYAYPTSPVGAEPAGRYILTSITPRGFPPGTDRFFVSFTRQR